MTKKEKELEKRIERLEANSDIQVGGGSESVCSNCGYRYRSSVELHIPPSSCNPERVKMMQTIKKAAK